MLDLPPALRTLLLADPTVSSIVGGTRVFPLRVPQGEKGDSLVYNRVSEDTEYSLAGASHLSVTRVQVDAWSTRVDGARLLANAVQDRLSGYRGMVAGVPVQGAFLVGGREDWDGEAQMFRVSRDYNVHYQDK
jgi:hypothetical protein